MKKVLMTAIAVAFLAPMAWAQVCCWEDNEYNAADGGGYCGPAADQYPTCEYGTAMQNCSACNTKNKTNAQPCSGYCKWTSGCEAINTDPDGEYGTATTTCDEAIANCDANSSGRYSDNACTQAITTPKVALGCCQWEAGGPCWTIRSGIDPEDGKDGEEKVTECRDLGYGTFWNGECPNGTGGCPSGASTGGNSSPSQGGNSSPSQGSYCDTNPSDPSCNGNSPIIALPNAAVTNAISAMSNSVSLQVTGAATVRIYDMKGTALRVQRVEKGSYVVQLSNLPRGLYIVQAASGSWRQTAKVAVK